MDSGLSYFGQLCGIAVSDTGIFKIVLEFHENSSLYSGGPAAGRDTGRMGICSVPFQGQKHLVFRICYTDAASVSGDYVCQISGFEWPEPAGHPCGRDSACGVFHFSGVSDLPGIQGNSQGTIRGGAD